MGLSVRKHALESVILKRVQRLYHVQLTTLEFTRTIKSWKRGISNKDQYNFVIKAQAESLMQPSLKALRLCLPYIRFSPCLKAFQSILSLQEDIVDGSTDKDSVMENFNHHESFVKTLSTFSTNEINIPTDLKRLCKAYNLFSQELFEFRSEQLDSYCEEFKSLSESLANQPNLLEQSAEYLKAFGPKMIESLRVTHEEIALLNQFDPISQSFISDDLIFIDVINGYIGSVLNMTANSQSIESFIKTMRELVSFRPPHNVVSFPKVSLGL